MALSSRNKLLDNNNLKKAAEVVNFIKKIKVKNYSLAYKKKHINIFFKKNKIYFDYIKFINLKKFKILKKQSRDMRIFIAFYINGVRLIDNI